MKSCLTIWILILLLIFNNAVNSQSKKLAPPESGMYHWAYPNNGATEDSVTSERILAFDSLTGNPVTCVYFSNNWFRGIKFPQKGVEIISSLGKIPLIRMMPRSDFIESAQDPVYTMQKFIEGDFDNELIQYARDAKIFANPLLIEFGTEVNGDWFSWNGKYNGAGESGNYGNSDIPDGPERFRDAYRHIINIFRQEGADNITWVYHVNAGSSPNEEWNTMSAYYPGDDYIDWIGVSIYGAQVPGKEWASFTKIMDECYDKLCGISGTKPLAVIEFGVIEDQSQGNKAVWIENAMQSLVDGRYPRIKALSYWHSMWEDSNGRISNMRLDSSPEAIKMYRTIINKDFFRQGLIFTDR